MRFFKILFMGLISPYIILKRYIDNSIKDVNVYKYVAIDSDNNKETDYLCINKNIINNFLVVENKKLLALKTNKFIKYKYRYLNKKQISNKELIYFLIHVNKFLKTGNNLINSISLVIKKCKYKNLERILRMVRYDLMCGNDLSNALKMQGKSFPKLSIDVLSDKSNNEIDHLKEMEGYYKNLYLNDVNSTKLSIYKIFIIPYILMISMFILGYIIPKIYDLYKLLMDDELTFLKGFIIFSKFDNIVFILFMFLIVLYFLILIFSNIYKIRMKLEYIAMNLLKSIINREMVVFSKTFVLIIKYNIKDSEIFHKITNNQYYNKLLIECFNCYQKEQLISYVLKDKKYFPSKAYEMIKSGEKFDSLLLQMNNISNYYQSRIDKNKKVVMRVIGPLIIIFSTLLFSSIFIILLLFCLLIIK